MKHPVRLLLIGAVTALALLFIATSTFATPVATGAPAPDVTAPNQAGEKVKFSDIYAKGTTLVYFYPKAGTSGCTKEACSFRDAFAKLNASGLQIIGVSRDTVEAQANFQTQYKLPFTLVSDADGSVSKAFGVPSTLGLDHRQSFIIKDGKVAWESLSAKTDGASDEVQKALDSLK
jgi:peroxiredoxin Q/BCP